MHLQGHLSNTSQLPSSKFLVSIMLFANASVHKTHYDILGVKEDATHEEIRTSYRSAILNSHPDKLQKTSETSKSNQDEPREGFLEIQRAWEILGDLKSREIYDSKLQAFRQDEVTADDITLEDLTVEDAGDIVEFFHQCRCGDYFSIDSLELGEMGLELLRDGNKLSLQAPNDSRASVVLPCGSCSLKVCLLINSDTWLENHDP